MITPLQFAAGCLVLFSVLGAWALAPERTLKVLGLVVGVAVGAYLGLRVYEWDLVRRLDSSTRAFQDAQWGQARESVRELEKRIR